MAGVVVDEAFPPPSPGAEAPAAGPLQVPAQDPAAHPPQAPPSHPPEDPLRAAASAVVEAPRPATAYRAGAWAAGRRVRASAALPLREVVHQARQGQGPQGQAGPQDQEEEPLVEVHSSLQAASVVGRVGDRGPALKAQTPAAQA